MEWISWLRVTRYLRIWRDLRPRGLTFQVNHWTIMSRWQSQWHLRPNPSLESFGTVNHKTLQERQLTSQCSDNSSKRTFSKSCRLEVNSTKRVLTFWSNRKTWLCNLTCFRRAMQLREQQLQLLRLWLRKTKAYKLCRPLCAVKANGLTKCLKSTWLWYLTQLLWRACLKTKPKM